LQLARAGGRKLIKGVDPSMYRLVDDDGDDGADFAMSMSVEVGHQQFIDREKRVKSRCGQS
jgi:hypothetical protein